MLATHPAPPNTTSPSGIRCPPHPHRHLETRTPTPESPIDPISHHLRRSSPTHKNKNKNPGINRGLTRLSTAIYFLIPLTPALIPTSRIQPHRIKHHPAKSSGFSCSSSIRSSLTRFGRARTSRPTSPIRKSSRNLAASSRSIPRITSSTNPLNSSFEANHSPRTGHLPINSTPPHSAAPCRTIPLIAQ